MGLDMYLKRKKYIGAHWEHRNVKGSIDITINGHKCNIAFDKISEITEQFGYWRKANAIHKWFVDNVQDGVDDCKEYYVEEDDLKRLLDTCKKVKENHDLASELLPTTQGFFFGSQEYDEYYFMDIDETIEILEKALKDIEEDENKGFDGYSYYYESSW